VYNNVMGIAHERLIHGIEEDYPNEVESMATMTQNEGLKPLVAKEYLKELCGDDEELVGHFDDMIEYFYRYTRDVCAQEALKHDKDGLQSNLEEIRAMEEPRRVLHDAMIDSVKIFARNLATKGKDSSWITDIDKRGRVGYANLALLTTFVDILNQNHA
jgi:hypothetical protein